MAGQPADIDSYEAAREALVQEQIAEALAVIDGASDSDDGDSSSHETGSPDSGFVYYQTENGGLAYGPANLIPHTPPTYFNYTRNGGSIRDGHHFRPMDLSKVDFGESFRSRGELLASFAGGKDNILGMQRLAAFMDTAGVCEGTSTNPNSKNGGYDVGVGGSVGADPFTMVHIGRLGINSSAWGKYQYLSSTWRGTMGDADPRNPLNQDTAFLRTVKKAGALDDILAGRYDIAAIKLNGIWASFPGDRYGQGGKSMSEFKQIYETALAHIQGTNVIAKLVKDIPADATAQANVPFMVIGDSLGVGAFAAAQKLGATVLGSLKASEHDYADSVYFDGMQTARQGAMTSEVVQKAEAVAAMAKARGQKYNFILSTGLTNDGKLTSAGLINIRTQLEALLPVANHIQIVGLATRSPGQETYDGLQQFIDQFNAAHGTKGKIILGSQFEGHTHPDYGYNKITEEAMNDTTKAIEEQAASKPDEAKEQDAEQAPSLVPSLDELTAALPPKAHKGDANAAKVAAARAAPTPEASPASQTTKVAAAPSSAPAVAAPIAC